jgi:hypothetical protein
LLSQRRWLAALLALRHPGAEQYFCRPRLRASGRNNFLQHRQKQRRGLITADSQPQLQVPENPFAPRRKNKIPKKKTEEEKKRISMNLSEEDCPKKMGTLTPRFQRHSSTAPGSRLLADGEGRDSSKTTSSMGGVTGKFEDNSSLIHVDVRFHFTTLRQRQSGSQETQTP